MLLQVGDGQPRRRRDLDDPLGLDNHKEELISTVLGCNRER